MFSRLREDVRTVIENDPAAKSTAEALTYPGVHALLFHRLAHRFHTRGFRLIARIISQFARFLTGIEIHPGAKIGRRLFIDHGMGVVIGETAVIGDDVVMFHGITLGGTSEDPKKRHPTLGDGVLLGAHATLLGPITVGDDAQIGAGAVVIEDVAPGATMIGVPAKAVE
ncbi:serine O-acetyltransferase [Haladaptatus sp. DYSN1]|uniref:serine O-acetyltransferase n=1 Tax=unclassified Haladaptatus TaxID=2622732 RepID=UPI0024059010|nr:serine O-acetyltransferase [Haladaptatus sp. DYSN1]